MTAIIVLVSLYLGASIGWWIGFNDLARSERGWAPIPWRYSAINALKGLTWPAWVAIIVGSAMLGRRR